LLYSKKTRKINFVIVLGCGSVLFGCERSSVSDGLSESTDCSSCHGNAGNPAPPKAVNGSSNTTEIGVGAHTAHLVGSNRARPVACVECHPMPTDLITHPDISGRPANVTFGTLSTLNGAVPVWDRATVTCRNTYCHGATLSGSETRVAPLWTKVDGSQRNCASCHGFPPGGTHPTSVQCETCHGDVAGPGGTIKTPQRHVDGVLDFGTTTASRKGYGPSNQLVMGRFFGIGFNGLGGS
jgi:predicted CxxxxCH...CXXCH cytochrome family protein